MNGHSKKRFVMLEKVHTVCSIVRHVDGQVITVTVKLCISER